MWPNGRPYREAVMIRAWETLLPAMGGGYAIQYGADRLRNEIEVILGRDERRRYVEDASDIRAAAQPASRRARLNSGATDHVPWSPCARDSPVTGLRSSSAIQ